MSALDPSFERARRQLRAWELTDDPARLPLAAVDELVEEARFVDFYAPAGLRRALEHYGIADRLAEMGFDAFEIVVEREDPFHHRLQLFSGGGRTDEERLLDLRLHLREVHVGDEHFQAVGIEWMAMQNPKAAFGTAFPRLPGQRHPGTQLGRAAHNLLMIMAERIGRQALIATPSRWHLARLYMRAGYRFASPAQNDVLMEVGVCTRRLRFAAAAWAVERGCVRDATTGEVYTYQPDQMLLPLSPMVKLRVRLAVVAVREAARALTPRQFEVDVERLQQSLREDPVEGLVPDAIFGHDF